MTKIFANENEELTCKLENIYEKLDSRDKSLKETLKALKSHEQSLFLKVEEIDDVVQKAVQEETEKAYSLLERKVQEELRGALNSKLSKVHNLSLSMEQYIEKAQFLKNWKKHLIVGAFCCGSIATSVAMIYYIPVSRTYKEYTLDAKSSVDVLNGAALYSVWDRIPTDIQKILKDNGARTPQETRKLLELTERLEHSIEKNNRL